MAITWEQKEQKELGKKMIGIAIRQLRVKLGWTQLELAKHLGHRAEPGMVSRWERGRLAPHPFYMGLLKKLARRNGFEQLDQFLTDPVPNWKSILAVAEPELMEILTRLEVAVLNSGDEHENPEDGLNLQNLRQDLAAMEMRLVARCNAGERPFVYTNAQRESWLKTQDEYAKLMEGRDGKTTAR